MKRIFFLLCSLLVVALANAYEHEWENPTVIDRGKEAPHAWFRTASSMSLNGTWRFRYDADIKQRPVDFYREDYDDHAWSPIRVPGNWELQGFGAPLYCNITYPWTPNPPYIDIDIPVGSYRTTFTLPDSFRDKELMLHFGSITGYARIYVNGREVGMTKCSKTPAEFDITPFVRQGKNLLAVQVFRWHDGSYMEDQDFWRLSGIERDVYIQAYPRHCLWDYSIQATPVDNYRNGAFSAQLFFRAFNGARPQGNVTAVLRDAKGKTVLRQEKAVNDSVVTFAGKLNNVRLWSAEHPNLYRLDLIYGADTIHERVGFREVKIVGPRMLVNGKVAYIKGVNHPEANDSLGHVTTREIVMHDIRMMKKMNMNAMRSSHYPLDPLWLELCDEYGIYVVDEANIENHGMGSLIWFKDTTNHPAYLPEWKHAHEDRIHRMFYRDRNHPSVICWSMGNECGNGVVFHEQYRWLKQHDATRYVQFEQAWENENADVVAPMYPNRGWMKNYATHGRMFAKDFRPDDDPLKARPFIMCEYAHAQGNSNGNLQDLWDVIKAAPNMQGGFIWDFEDQGIKRTINENTDHRTYYMYNGGMGSYVWPREENSGCDGVLAADGTPKPQAWEIKKVYQNIIFPSYDWQRDRLTVRNEYCFTSLADYAFWWTLCREGDEVARGTFALKTAPGDSSTVSIKLPKMADDAEYTLQVYAYNKVGTDVLPQGYEVAKEQFLREANCKEPSAGKVNVQSSKFKEEGNDIIVTMGNKEVKLSKKSGLIWSYTVDGKSPFAKGQYPQPYFWRAPNDNDYGNRMEERSNVWRSAQTNMSVKSFTVGETTDEGIPVDVVMTLDDIDQDYLLHYLFRPDGTIRITATMNTTGRKKLAELPRFGMRWALADGFEAVNYYGRGPQENYSDRKTSQFIGKYATTVTDLFYPYIRPQQTGYHADMRWMDVSNQRLATTMRISDAGTERGLGISVLHYKDEDLDPGITKKLLHTKDVLPHTETFVIVDGAQRGVGGDNSWGEPPHSEYRLFDGSYQLSFDLNFR